MDQIVPFQRSEVFLGNPKDIEALKINFQVQVEIILLALDFAVNLQELVNELQNLELCHSNPSESLAWGVKRIKLVILQ